MTERELSERLIRVEDTMSRVEKYLEKHEKIMQGNGALGCMARMIIVEKNTQDNEDNIRTIFRSIRHLNRNFYIASGIVSAVMFIIANKDAIANFLK